LGGRASAPDPSGELKALPSSPTGGEGARCPSPKTLPAIRSFGPQAAGFWTRLTPSQSSAHFHLPSDVTGPTTTPFWGQTNLVTAVVEVSRAVSVLCPTPTALRGGRRSPDPQLRPE